MANHSKEYNSNHYRVYKAFGKASEYLCYPCWKQGHLSNAEHWAWFWRSYPDPADPNGYFPLCRQHHDDYDHESRSGKLREYRTQMARRTQEHNDHISEAMLRRYQDDPEYAELLSQSARRRWVREYNDEVNRVLDECEAGRLQRFLQASVIPEDSQQLDDIQKTLLRAVRLLNRNVQKAERGHFIHKPEKESGMSTHDAASRPFVSEHQTRHPPMTTGPEGHVHDHAAHGADDHDDGIHGGDGPHVHTNDADHNPASNNLHKHPHGHGPGAQPGKPSAHFQGPVAQYNRNYNGEF